MTMDIGAAGLSAGRRRRVLQIIFVFVNLALVESHIPGMLWLVIGSIFWIALIFIAASGSSLICGTMCWVGAIQDFAEPLARSRVRIDPRWGRGLTLTLLLLWIPIGWFFWPHAAAHDRTPLNIDPTAWQSHLFGLGLALAIPLCVMLLGKRGICRFLCPFNNVSERRAAHTQPNEPASRTIGAGPYDRVSGVRRLRTRCGTASSASNERTRRMKSTRPIKGVLIIWAIWEIINGALSTFAPQQGASLVSWAPKSGWTSDLLLMSQQYGMVMFVLGVMYLIVATNPLRYRSLIWVAVAEQAIGITYALSSFLGAHTLTLPQFLTLAVGNIVIAAIFILLRPVEMPTTPRRAGATA